MSRHQIYPVPRVLLQDSTLYPSFLPSLFSFLCVTCCFSIYVAVRPHLYYPHTLLCYVPMPFILTFFSFTLTHVMTGAFILAVFLVLSVLHSFFPSLLSPLFNTRSFPFLYFTLHVLSLNSWFVLFICFISLFV